MKHETSGLLFPPGYSHELVRHIKDLVKKPEKRNEMGEKAKQIFACTFTLSDMAKKGCRPLLRDYKVDKSLNKNTTTFIQ